MSLLSVRSLSLAIETLHGEVPAVEDVSFEVGHGEVLGVVGESGSGKSLTCLSILGLVAPPVRRTGGTVRFEGSELSELSESRWRAIRGREISMVFQEPLTSLDAVFTVGDQLAETVRAHERTSRRAAMRRAAEMLDRVGIPDAGRRLRSYPHELSGGMRQRVMIAMALILKPKLLLADEPLTALDVTTQAQILDLILDLQREMEMSVVLVSHDLGVVLDAADRILVMYSGQIVEASPAKELFARPLHPYSGGLLASKLSLFEPARAVAVMPGQIPGLGRRPPGCRFAPRCPNRLTACDAGVPPLLPAHHDDGALRCLNPLGSA